ncbi:RNA polymerase sigma factor [Actinomadura montaniterrae]|uniref:Uncharacterized protein n=1 Tax=Actinomadura montaniterrae TaxID=1803903 RepID=A0A6L3VPS8_9ACTN|nr:sigma factor-like helix-turn-helix DNA-binding protein [Actinomadura montaniterrae]KAB2374185.1 hypothetical protein F9B16_27910 [Actinomadura montaniterrae]
MSRDEVEDIAGVVAFELWRHPATLRKIVEEGRDPKQYVRKVAYHACLKSFGQKQNRHEIDAVGFEIESDGGVRNPFSGPSGEAADDLRLRSALARLDLGLRVIVFMRIYQDKTIPMIHEDIGIPLETVKSRWRRAKELLRKEFQIDQDNEEAE